MTNNMQVQPHSKVRQAGNARFYKRIGEMEALRAPPENHLF